MSTVRYTNNDLKNGWEIRAKQRQKNPLKYSTLARTKVSRAIARNMFFFPGETTEKNIYMDKKALKMQELHASGDFKRMEFKVRLMQNWWIIRSSLLILGKRALDLFLGLLALLGFLPIVIITAIAIKLDSPGPIFFRQKRVGKWGQPFTCFKFRSMFIDAEKRKLDLLVKNEADEVVFKMRNDPRVTRVGRIIRKLSIDELPQLINVIRGDMSLVGPRPPVPIEVAQYEYDQFRRLDAVPGITGLQQVSGRSELPFKRWVELDVEYIENWTLTKDVEILLKTIPAVITGKGAY
jgi:exopolysaccharide biosynthesis polyprenyl glycosylphosphotransferase